MDVFIVWVAAFVFNPIPCSFNTTYSGLADDVIHTVFLPLLAAEAEKVSELMGIELSLWVVREVDRAHYAIFVWIVV